MEAYDIEPGKNTRMISGKIAQLIMEHPELTKVYIPLNQSIMLEIFAETDKYFKEQFYQILLTFRFL